MINTKQTLILIAMIAIFTVTSCNNPLNKKYNEQTLEQDAKEIYESKKLNEDEAKLLTGYIMLAKLGGKNLEGKTYKEILQAAKDYKSEQEQLAAKARKEEEEKRIKLGAALSVAMYDKGYGGEGYQAYLQYAVAFENKTDKDIRAVKGSLKITDLFDTTIKSITIVEDNGIPAHETIKNVFTTDYNKYRDEDTILANKKMQDIKVIWTPEKIIFTDGTSLE
jgi:hypothetical protein